jgi:hypothetical protein
MNRRKLFGSIAAVTAVAVLPSSLSASPAKLLTPDSSIDDADVIRIKKIVNKGVFVHGWGFDVSKVNGQIAILLYTPIGTDKWQLLLTFPVEFIKDKDFDWNERLREVIGTQAPRFIAYKEQHGL